MSAFTTKQKQMCAKLVVAIVILCVVASGIMIPLDIHPMFGIISLLVGMLSALVVLLTVSRVCRRALSSVLMGAAVGPLVGALVSALSISIRPQITL